MSNLSTLSHRYNRSKPTLSVRESTYNDDLAEEKCPLRSVENPENMSSITNKLNYPFIYCWITSNGIVGDASHFNFKHILYIQHHHENEISLCSYNFQTNWKTIKFLHNKSFISHDSRIHFAQMRFPKTLPETNKHREKKLINIRLSVSGFIRRIYNNHEDILYIDMLIINLCFSYMIKQESLAIQSTLDLMDDVLMINGNIKTIQSFDDRINGDYICKGPGRAHSRAKFWSFEQKTATNNDNDAVSHFLCQLLNSPSFVINSKHLFNQCGINDYMKNILQSKANSILNNLRDLVKQYIFYSKEKQNLHQMLLAPQWKDIRFHTLYIVQRPTGGNKLSLMDHWALKLEGNEWLLTLEWFSSDSFFVKFQKNDCFGQKVFWFSWTKNRKQVFNQRWGTLSKIYLNQIITAQYIGILLNKWLTYCIDKGFNPKYNRMTNNCQHFVRDFVSVFNENVAEYLTTKFHHREIEKIMTPSGALSNDWNEYTRIQEIRKILLKAMEIGNNNDGVQSTLSVRTWTFNEDEDDEKTQSALLPHKDIHDFLKQIGKFEYFDIFISNGFDTMDAVKLLTDDHLKEIGVQKLGHRQLILDKIQKL